MYGRKRLLSADFPISFSQKHNWQFSRNLFEKREAVRRAYSIRELLSHAHSGNNIHTLDEPIEQQVKAAGLSINSDSAPRAFQASPNFRQRARLRGGIILRPRAVPVIIIIWSDSAWIQRRKMHAAARGVSACVIRKVAKCSVTLLYARTKALE